VIDIEALLIAWLEETIEDVRASTETPPDLDARLPWVQVTGIGGTHDGFKRDQPTADVTAYAATTTEASDLAAQIHDLLHEQLARSVYGGAVINRIRTNVRPHRVPYDNPNMRRYEASYGFVVHPA
jgi:hypothetical protein